MNPTGKELANRRKQVALSLPLLALQQLDELAQVAQQNRSEYVRTMIRRNIADLRIAARQTLSRELFVIRTGDGHWVAVEDDLRFTVTELPVLPGTYIHGSPLSEGLTVYGDIVQTFPSGRRLHFALMNSKVRLDEHVRVITEIALKIFGNRYNETDIEELQDAYIE